MCFFHIGLFVFLHPGTMSRSKKEEYERLRGLINQWNDDHYDIFELSLPNEVIIT